MTTKITTTKIRGLWTADIRGAVFTLDRDYDGDWVIHRKGKRCTFRDSWYWSTKRDCLDILGNLFDGNYAPVEGKEDTHWAECEQGWRNLPRARRARRIEAARAARREVPAILENVDPELHETPKGTNDGGDTPLDINFPPDTRDYTCTCTRAAQGHASYCPAYAIAERKPAPEPAPHAPWPVPADRMHPVAITRARIAFAYLATKLHADGITHTEIASALGISPGSAEVLASEDTPADYPPPVLIGVSLSSEWVCAECGYAVAGEGAACDMCALLASA